MPLVTTADLLTAARRAGRGLPAFNVITLEHAEAIVDGAERAKQPVILQISQNAVRFHGDRLEPMAAATAAAAGAALVDVSLHLDHVERMDLLWQAADTGFSSAMFDVGALPYRDNVDRTAAAVHELHARGLLVEAELGYVGGKADAPQSAHSAGVLTDPREAEEFVAATGVDALAVAVGSSHAMTSRSAVLNIDRIASLRQRLSVPLVLHGSSGVPDETLRAAVTAGMTKINIGTALNIAMTAAVRQALTDAELVDPRKYLTPGRDAMAGAVASLCAVIAGPPPPSHPLPAPAGDEVHGRLQQRSPS